MTNLRKAAEMVIEAHDEGYGKIAHDLSIQALRQALAQPEQMTDKEKVAQWMIQQGYATGHGDTVEDLLKELEWQILENWHRAMVNGVETEREACAVLCEKECAQNDGITCAEEIRARGEK